MTYLMGLASRLYRDLGIVSTIVFGICLLAIFAGLVKITFFGA